MEEIAGLSTVVIDPFGTIRERECVAVLTLIDHLDGTFTRVLPEYVKSFSPITPIGAFRRAVRGVEADLEGQMVKVVLGEDIWEEDVDRKPPAIRLTVDTDRIPEASRDRRAVARNIMGSFPLIQATLKKSAGFGKAEWAIALHLVFMEKKPAGEKKNDYPCRLIHTRTPDGGKKKVAPSVLMPSLSPRCIGAGNTLEINLFWERLHQIEKLLTGAKWLRDHPDEIEEVLLPDVRIVCIDGLTVFGDAALSPRRSLPKDEKEPIPHGESVLLIRMHEHTSFDSKTAWMVSDDLLIDKNGRESNPFGWPDIKRSKKHFIDLTPKDSSALKPDTKLTKKTWAYIKEEKYVGKPEE